MADTAAMAGWSDLSRERGLVPVLERLAEGSLRRDTEGGDFRAEFKELVASGLGAARIPVARGGWGFGVKDLLTVVIDLAYADPSLAHAMRNHFIFVEQALQDRHDGFHGSWIAQVSDGLVVGNSFTESETAGAGARSFDARLSRHGEGWVLNGRKVYSTGNLYADVLFVSAVDEDDREVVVVVPTDRAGVRILDDWDGIGQKQSASGTTLYENVPVSATELRWVDDLEPPLTPAPRLGQIYLTTVIAGILARALHDTVEAVRTRRRNFYHGLQESPSDEPSVQQSVGELSTLAYVARTAVLAVGESVDVALETAEKRAELLFQASLDGARAKAFVDEAASKAAWLPFEAAGGSAVGRSIGLDRHWRNARTLASHNPRTYKLRYLGDFELNARRPPEGSFF